jgi:hypothetical protein
VRHIAALTRQVLLDSSKLFGGDFHSASISNMFISVNRPYGITSKKLVHVRPRRSQ